MFGGRLKTKAEIHLIHDIYNVMPLKMSSNISEVYTFPRSDLS